MRKRDYPLKVILRISLASPFKSLLVRKIMKFSWWHRQALSTTLSPNSVSIRLPPNSKNTILQSRPCSSPIYWNTSFRRSLELLFHCWQIKFPSPQLLSRYCFGRPPMCSMVFQSSCHPRRCRQAHWSISENYPYRWSHLPSERLHAMCDAD